jgi:hypothetical protein
MLAQRNSTVRPLHKLVYTTNVNCLSLLNEIERLCICARSCRCVPSCRQGVPRLYTLAMAAVSIEHKQEVADFEKLLDSFFTASDPKQGIHTLDAFAAESIVHSPGNSVTKLQPTGSGSNISSDCTEANNNTEVVMSAPPVSQAPPPAPPVAQQAAPVTFTQDMLDFLNGSGALVSFPSQQTPGASLYAFTSQPAVSSMDTKSDTTVAKAEKSRSAQRRFR